MNESVDIRPLRAADIDAARDTAYSSLREAGRHYGWEMPELDDVSRARWQRRLRHGVVHDPDGSWVAERDGEVVGVGVATRRGAFWFLSLLAVRTSLQGKGLGQRLLNAALATYENAGAICASDDPKALRRYRLAGFDLLAAYEASGVIQRSLLPAVTGVRDGSYQDDRELVEEVAVKQRGGPHGPDLDFFAAEGWPLFVTESSAGTGYVVARPASLVVLGASSAEAASRLLWTALAHMDAGKAEVAWLSPSQQWALDVALAARLSLRSTGSVCRRGATGPLAPYIPNGAFG
jgi:predicted N-acetyltransferase YhbS